MPKFHQSMRFALNGLIILLRKERNFRIMGIVSVIVVIVGYSLDYFGEHLNRFEWAILWCAMGLVFVSEGLNTALETTIDVIHPEQNPMIGRAKDMAAGATLAASFVAIIVGIYIFGPHVMSILGN
ncbi:MAG: diacylglycerol kinase family protein [Flavobacteriaceae bacterium]|nr:diacylglycerol kinase family protein [Flavobacteriaceae bacterium]PHX76949.1 MAG: diacylglycerol kinase [Flavobacteriales bacterium]